MVRKMVIGKRNPAGLTIMELIITLVVLATLLAIAFPTIGQISAGYRLRGAARELATDLQFARLLAVKENKSFQVVCDSHSYQVVRSDGFVAKSRDFGVDYPEVSLTALAVNFNSRGNSTSSQTITVSNSTATKNITVGSTGRVWLQ